MKLQRRTILKFAAAIGLSMGRAIAWSQSGSTRVRYRATEQAAGADLQALSDAIRKMLTVSDARRTDSWMYWANVHGTTQRPPQAFSGIWATCDHGNYFLAWHRLYLLYFEAAVASASGKADFAMPYWDWYRSADIPPAFSSPGSTANPLWREARGYAERYPINTLVLSASGYGVFNSRAFGNPHSNIHVNFDGEMGDPSTAARDPVFWPHHAAMDRLWEIWLAQNPSNTNPSTSDPWASRQFTFLPGGGAGPRSVREILKLADLNYRYDSLAVTQIEAFETIPAKPTRAEIGTSKVQRSVPESTTRLAVVSEKRLTNLTGSALTIRLPLHSSSGPVFEAVGASGAQGATATVRFEGVRLTPEGRKRRVLYDIYINLPVARPPTANLNPISKVRHKIGQISSFGLVTHDGHSAHSRGLRLDLSITDLVPQLKAAGAWDPNMVEIDLIEPSERGGTVPLIIMEQIQLLLGHGSENP